jgi:hypothetical protein
MKRRWAVLFWCALATLAGLSWLAARFGLHLTSMMNIGFVGMIAACIVAFFAMHKDVRAKWPAGVALACAAPMTIDAVQILPHIPEFIGFIGFPGILLFGGTLATAATALVILVLQLPPPPKDDPVPSARVVD